MPIYEFQCVCGYQHEVITLRAGTDLTVRCQKCGMPMVRKPSVPQMRSGEAVNRSSQISQAIDRVKAQKL